MIAAASPRPTTRATGTSPSLSDRKSGGEGKRGDLGGWRIIKKKKKKITSSCPKSPSKLSSQILSFRELVCYMPRRFISAHSSERRSDLTSQCSHILGEIDPLT